MSKMSSLAARDAAIRLEIVACAQWKPGADARIFTATLGTTDFAAGARPALCLRPNMRRLGQDRIGPIAARNLNQDHKYGG